MCARCWAELAFVSAPVCARCGLGLQAESAADGEAVCGACHVRPPRFDRARAALAYDDASSRLILAFKHASRLEATPLFARWLETAGAALIAEADLIAPAPLHWRRLLWRRYNQAAELARRVARDAGRVYAPDLLVRPKATPSQSGLSAGQRRRNLAGALALNPAWSDRIDGKRVLVVDDVFTTGATAEQAALALRRAGAAAVDVLTVARVERPRPV